MKSVKLNSLFLALPFFLNMYVAKAAVSVNLDVPVRSMFHSYDSRFSVEQAKVFKSSISKILSQIGCQSNLDTIRRQATIDSEAVELQVLATCSQSYDLSFQTLTTELAKHVSLNPDLLFLNGRLVQMSGKMGEMKYSDGELITPKNVGKASIGYTSHPSKLKDLDHIDNVAQLRNSMANAGFKIGATALTVGGAAAVIGSSSRSALIIYDTLHAMGSSQKILSAAWSFLNSTTTEAVLGLTGSTVAVAGTAIALVTFPTSSQASDLDAMYKRPEYHSKLLVSKAYGNLASEFGSDTNKIIIDYQKNVRLNDLIKKYAQTESQEKAVVNFYNWWR